MKVNINGNIFGSSGYAAHTRSLANALNEQGIDVRIESPLPQGWEMNVTDAELNMINKPFSEDYTTVVIGQPPYWSLAIADNPKSFIGFCVWEGDKVPKYWIEYLFDLRVDQIWVPSEHTKQAIINTFNETIDDSDIGWDIDTTNWSMIKVVPHGVNTNLFKPTNKASDRPFTFLVNKGWVSGINDRGGTQYALKAFDEEFSNEDNVRLICKINPAYNTPNWNLQEEMNKIGLGGKRDGKAPIQITMNNVDFKALPELYKKADVFVCATRCEAFGLPGLEAHAMGLPTIQTNYGGQLDYMSAGTDWYISSDSELVTFDLQYEGISWAVPDVQDLRKAMRYCYENQDLVKQKGQLALESVKDWTWTETAKKAKTFLKELQ